jgi:hypothetical protein
LNHHHWSGLLCVLLELKNSFLSYSLPAVWCITLHGTGSQDPSLSLINDLNCNLLTVLPFDRLDMIGRLGYQTSHEDLCCQGYNLPSTRRK